MAATVIAYEVEQRLCEFGQPGVREYGWHHATLTAFAAPLASGRALPAEVVREAQTIALAFGEGSNGSEGDTGRLAELAVTWVLQNPEPVALASPGYKR